jgi:hypothetical protein
VERTKQEAAPGVGQKPAAPGGKAAEGQGGKPGRRARPRPPIPDAQGYYEAERNRMREQILLAFNLAADLQERALSLAGAMAGWEASPTPEGLADILKRLAENAASANEKTRDILRGKGP